MALKETLNADLKTAMLARDSFLVETLRGLKSVILAEEVAKQKRDEGLSDEEIEQLFAREAKKRDESAGLFEQGGNQEAADKERAEKVIIQKYLPEQLNEAAIATMIDEVISQTGAVSVQDMGKVIGAVKAKAGNAADGTVIARLVKEKLNS